MQIKATGCGGNTNRYPVFIVGSGFRMAANPAQKTLTVVFDEVLLTKKSDLKKSLNAKYTTKLALKA